MINIIHEIYHDIVQSKRSLIIAWIPDYKTTPEHNTMSLEEENVSPETGSILTISHTCKDLWTHIKKAMDEKVEQPLGKYEIQPSTQTR